MDDQTKCETLLDSFNKNRSMKEGISKSMYDNQIKLVRKDLASEVDGDQETALRVLQKLIDNNAHSIQSDVIYIISDDSIDQRLKNKILERFRNYLRDLLRSCNVSDLVSLYTVWQAYDVRKFAAILKQVCNDDEFSQQSKTFLMTALVPAILDTKNAGDISTGSCINLALEFASVMSINILTSEEFNSFYTRVNDYIKTISELRDKHFIYWHKLWIFLVRFFGKKLHFSMNLMNKLLRVVEHAFRNSSHEQRIRGYDCWKELIDNVSLDSNHISSEKQIRLLLTPLRAKFSRQEAVIVKRFEVFVYLIEKLQDKAVLVLKEFLEFCFGEVGENTDPHKAGQGRSMPELWLRSANVFLAVLGHSHDTNEQCLETVPGLHLKSPVLNSNNISEVYCHVVNSVAECCRLLKEVELDQHRNIVLKCFWRSLLNMMLNDDVQHRDNYIAAVRKVLDSFLTGNEPYCQSIAAIIFKEVVKIDKSKALPLVLSSLEQFLNVLFSVPLSKESCIDVEKFLAILSNCDSPEVTAQATTHVFNAFTRYKTVDTNADFVAEIWIFLANEVEGDANGDWIDFLVWPVQHLHQLTEPVKEASVYDHYERLLSKLVARSDDIHLALFKRFERVLKSNPSLWKNILSLVTMFNPNPSNKNITNVTLDMLAFMLLGHATGHCESQREAVELYLKKLYEADITKIRDQDTIRKLCNCVEYLLKQNHHDILVPLEEALRNLPDKVKWIHGKFLTMDFLMDKFEHETDLKVSEKIHKVIELLRNVKNPESKKDITSMMPVGGRSAKIAHLVKNIPPSPNKAPSSPTTFRLFGKEVETPLKIIGSQLNNTKITPKKDQLFTPPKPKKSTFIDDESNSKFILIDSEVKLDKNKLTEHQKETLAKRREDIPALYQDLSQSQSLDSTSICVAKDVVVFKKPEGVDEKRANGKPAEDEITVPMEEESKEADPMKVKTIAKDKKAKIESELKKLSMNIVGAEEFVSAGSKRKRREKKLEAKSDGKKKRSSIGQKVKTPLSNSKDEVSGGESATESNNRSPVIDKPEQNDQNQKAVIRSEIVVPLVQIGDSKPSPKPETENKHDLPTANAVPSNPHHEIEIVLPNQPLANENETESKIGDSELISSILAQEEKKIRNRKSLTLHDESKELRKSRRKSLPTKRIMQAKLLNKPPKSLTPGSLKRKKHIAEDPQKTKLYPEKPSTTPGSSKKKEITEEEVQKSNSFPEEVASKRFPSSTPASSKKKGKVMEEDVQKLNSSPESELLPSATPGSSKKKEHVMEEEEMPKRNSLTDENPTPLKLFPTSTPASAKKKENVMEEAAPKPNSLTNEKSTPSKLSPTSTPGNAKKKEKVMEEAVPKPNSLTNEKPTPSKLSPTSTPGNAKKKEKVMEEALTKPNSLTNEKPTPAKLFPTSTPGSAKKKQKVMEEAAPKPISLTNEKPTPSKLFPTSTPGSAKKKQKIMEEAVQKPNSLTNENPTPSKLFPTSTPESAKKKEKVMEEAVPKPNSLTSEEPTTSKLFPISTPGSSKNKENVMEEEEMPKPSSLNDEKPTPSKLFPNSTPGSSKKKEKVMEEDVQKPNSLPEKPTPSKLFPTSAPGSTKNKEKVVEEDVQKINLCSEKPTQSELFKHTEDEAATENPTETQPTELPLAQVDQAVVQTPADNSKDQDPNECGSTGNAEARKESTKKSHHLENGVGKTRKRKRLSSSDDDDDIIESSQESTVTRVSATKLRLSVSKRRRSLAEKSSSTDSDRNGSSIEDMGTSKPTGDEQSPNNSTDDISKEIGDGEVKKKPRGRPAKVAKKSLDDVNIATPEPRKSGRIKSPASNVEETIPKRRRSNKDSALDTSDELRKRGRPRKIPNDSADKEVDTSGESLDLLDSPKKGRRKSSAKQLQPVAATHTQSQDTQTQDTEPLVVDTVEARLQLELPKKPSLTESEQQFARMDTASISLVDLEDLKGFDLSKMGTTNKTLTESAIIDMSKADDDEAPTFVDPEQLGNDKAPMLNDAVLSDEVLADIIGVTIIKESVDRVPEKLTESEDVIGATENVCSDDVSEKLFMSEVGIGVPEFVHSDNVSEKLSVSEVGPGPTKIADSDSGSEKQQLSEVGLSSTEVVASGSVSEKLPVSESEEKEARASCDVTSEIAETEELVRQLADRDIEVTMEVECLSPQRKQMPEKCIGTPESVESSLPSSPVTGDTPNRTSELLNSTTDISPIGSKSSSDDEFVEERKLVPVALKFEQEDGDHDSPQQKSPEKGDDAPQKLDDTSPEKAEKQVEIIALGSPPKSDANVVNSAEKSSRFSWMKQSSPATYRLFNRRKTGHNMSPSASRIRKLMSNVKPPSQSECPEEISQEDILTFTREVPSPLAIPKSSILKRKHSDTTEDGMSPCAKRKRVNFSDPCTTSKKVFIKEETGPSQCLFSMSADDELNKQFLAVLEANDIIDSPQTESDNIETEPSLQINNALLLRDDVSIYPELVNCDENISVISRKLTGPMFVNTLLSKLSNKNIRTIGDLARQSEISIARLPFKTPMVATVYKALDHYYHKNFKSKGSAERTEIVAVNGEAGRVPKSPLQAAEVVVEKMDVKIELTKVLERARSENIPTDELCSLVLGPSDQNQVLTWVKSHFHLETKDLMEEKDFSHIVKHIRETTGLPKLLEILTESVESSDDESVYFDCIIKHSMEKRSLGSLLERRTLQELRTAIWENVEHGVYSKKQLLDTCFVPFATSVDLTPFFNKLTVVEISDVVLNRLVVEDYETFVQRIVAKCSNTEEVKQNILENYTISELTSNIVKRGSPKEIISSFTYMFLSADKDEEDLVQLFRLSCDSMSAKLAPSKLMELAIEFMRKVPIKD